MDLRNSCSKFLSSECPNNCHYDDWCKHYQGLLDEYYQEKEQSQTLVENKYWR